MITRIVRRRVLSLAILSLLVGTLGCGPRVATVEGTVTIDGKPANNGTVIFSSDNRSAGGAIGPDGYYIVENVPIGDVKLAVHQMMMMGGGPNRPGPLRGIEEPVSTVTIPIRIPKQYQNVKTSGLRFTISGDTSGLNIELVSP